MIINQQYSFSKGFGRGEKKRARDYGPVCFCTINSEIQQFHGCLVNLFLIREDGFFKDTVKANRSKC